LLHINLNHEIILESKFIIIVTIVVYCTNPLENNDIFIICYICDKCTCHHSKSGYHQPA